MQLSMRFKQVHAFEPIERHRECFVRNAPKAKLYPCALGNEASLVKLKKGVNSTGDTHISDDGEYLAEIHRLDEYQFKDVDFIKIDCEGYELYVLQGGEETIEKYKPAVIVEQKPGKAESFGLGQTDAVKWLQDRGYTLRDVIAGDYILSVD